MQGLCQHTLTDAQRGTPHGFLNLSIGIYTHSPGSSTNVLAIGTTLRAYCQGTDNRTYDGDSTYVLPRIGTIKKSICQ